MLTASNEREENVDENSAVQSPLFKLSGAFYVESDARKREEIELKIEKAVAQKGSDINETSECCPSVGSSLWLWLAALHPISLTMLRVLEKVITDSDRYKSDLNIRPARNSEHDGTAYWYLIIAALSSYISREVADGLARLILFVAQHYPNSRADLGLVGNCDYIGGRSVRWLLVFGCFIEAFEKDFDKNKHKKIDLDNTASIKIPGMYEGVSIAWLLVFQAQNDRTPLLMRIHLWDLIEKVLEKYPKLNLEAKPLGPNVDLPAKSLRQLIMEHGPDRVKKLITPADHSHADYLVALRDMLGASQSGVKFHIPLMSFVTLGILSELPKEKQKKEMEIELKIFSQLADQVKTLTDNRDTKFARLIWEQSNEKKRLSCYEKKSEPLPSSPDTAEKEKRKNEKKQKQRESD